MAGNYLYYRHAKSKIIEVRSTQSPQNVDSVLREIGGINKWITLIGIIIGILMLIFFAAFFTTMIASMGHLTGVTI